MVLKVISGGSAGAARGALDGARAAGVSWGGWAPFGWRVEGGRIPEAYRVGMRQATTGDLNKRIKRNVDDSDGTIVLWDARAGAVADRASQLTLALCGKLKVPHLRVDMRMDVAPEVWVVPVRNWLRDEMILTLHVAGPTERSYPGAQEWTAALIEAVLGSDLDAVRTSMAR